MKITKFYFLIITIYVWTATVIIGVKIYDKQKNIMKSEFPVDTLNKTFHAVQNGKVRKFEVPVKSIHYPVNDTLANTYGYLEGKGVLCIDYVTTKKTLLSAKDSVRNDYIVYDLEGEFAAKFILHKQSTDAINIIYRNNPDDKNLRICDIYLNQNWAKDGPYAQSFGAYTIILTDSKIFFFKEKEFLGDYKIIF